MPRTFVLVGVTLAIAAAPLLLAQPASAGASASAPSKYSNNQNRQIVVTQHVRQPKATEYPITEYSSSSAKTSVPRR